MRITEIPIEGEPSRAEAVQAWRDSQIGPSRSYDLSLTDNPRRPQAPDFRPRYGGIVPMDDQRNIDPLAAQAARQAEFVTNHRAPESGDTVVGAQEATTRVPDGIIEFEPDTGTGDVRLVLGNLAPRPKPE
jgi:hypothetical protein